MTQRIPLAAYRRSIFAGFTAFILAFSACSGDSNEEQPSSSSSTGTVNSISSSSSSDKAGNTSSSSSDEVGGTSSSSSDEVGGTSSSSSDEVVVHRCGGTGDIYDPATDVCCGISKLNPATEQCYNGVVLPKPVSKSVYNYTFDDIQFWVGEGSNRAMLIVQWLDEKEPAALVWGYKWDGEKYGVDMIFDIAKADSRFFVLGEYTGPLGVAVGGMGYSINGNLIQLKDPDGNLHTPVNGGVDGFGYNYDGWTCTDPSAHWESGWFDGYWSYWVSDNGTNSEWEYSQLGTSSRKLENNSVDAWWYHYDLYNEETGFLACMMGMCGDGRNKFGNLTSAINYN